MTGVVHVITALERGGAQRNTLDTAIHLHRERRPQLLVTGRAAALDDEAARALGRRLVHVPSLVGPISPVDDARALFDLHRLLDDAAVRLGSPIVVHTHSSKAGVLGRLAARAVRGAYVVHTVHGFGTDALGAGRAALLGAAERIAAPAAHVVIFVSSGDLERARETGLVRPDDVERGRARVIRSGIDPAPFAGSALDPLRRAAARARFGFTDDCVVAATVGNLKPQKDPLFHVDILAAWRRHEPRARLLFVGDGPLRDRMRARAVQAGVDDALVLTGFLDDPRDAYAAADVYLLASAWEGLPRSVLEAIAAGLPIVARDTGWCDDVLWCRNLTPLPERAAAGHYVDALVERTRRARRRSATKLPREFTRQGMLDALGALYDELVGPALDPPLRRMRLGRRR